MQMKVMSNNQFTLAMKLSLMAFNSKERMFYLAQNLLAAVNLSGHFRQEETFILSLLQRALHPKSFHALLVKISVTLKDFLLNKIVLCFDFVQIFSLLVIKESFLYAMTDIILVLIIVNNGNHLHIFTNFQEYRKASLI